VRDGNQRTELIQRDFPLLDPLGQRSRLNKHTVEEQLLPEVFDASEAVDHAPTVDGVTHGADDSARKSFALQ
jgi:hypothetical protein